MLKLLFKQAKNILKDFGIVHWLQLLLVVAVVSAYLIMRSLDLLSFLAGHFSFSNRDFAVLIPDIFISAVLFSSPFIVLYLLPRQKELMAFYTLPLSKKRLPVLLGYYYQKYQSLTLLLFLIPGIALTVRAILPGLAALLLLMFYALSLLVNFVLLFIQSASRIRFLFFSALLFGIHSIIFLSLIFSSFWIGLGVADFLFVFAVLVILLKRRKNGGQNDLALLFPISEKVYQPAAQEKWSFFSLLRFLPLKLQMMFKADFLSVWRNPRHRRLKIFTLILYLAVLAILKTTISGDIYMWLTLAGMAFIYLHYSNYFNKKYVLPEPDWYFLTLPKHYSQIWAAKFLAESVFIFILFICHWLFLLFCGASFSAQLNLLGLLLLFSFFTVSAMLNFQILFYDDPRLGGYAYHFMILLIFVMTVNYHLVGPLLGLFLLALNFYKSYKYFNA